MKSLLTFFVLLFSLSVVNAQTKIITGRVINEDLEPLPNARIHDMDTTILGSTDLKGYFKMEVPSEANQLLLGAIGMEWTSVKIEEECQNLEIIVMLHVIYDFISAESEKRKRKKRFKQLPKKHKEAYEKGLFKSSNPCVCYVFAEY